MWARRWLSYFWIFAVVLLVACCIAEESADPEMDYVTLYGQYDDDGMPNIIPEHGQDVIFDREQRKYSRRLWYINCTRRRRCHCYSRHLRQYFCCACDSGPCFPGDSKVVLMPSGDIISMNKLRIGQYVLAANEEGKLVGSKVLGFLDKRPNETAPYITLTLSSGHAVSLSANHLLYATIWKNSTKDKTDESSHVIPNQPVFAGEVRMGNYLFIPHEGLLKADPVIGITYGFKLGAYVPLTEHGSIIVDGTLASCYASFPHWLSHAILTPARYFPEILLDTEDSQDNHGLRTFPSILKMVGQAFAKIKVVNNYKSNDIIRLYTLDEPFPSPSL
ncbi:desert hedgehog protein B-like [Hetaerina americana]|uniref:desert hedgehog protein B-like n=1 Tax=Hetaerina americana TaxID=62018 RepID=UPI003A7F353C